MKLWRDDNPQDFQQAITAFQEAIIATPTTNPNRQQYLDTLFSALVKKFDQTGDFIHLDTLVNSTPKDDSDRAMWLNNLSIELGRQYQRGSGQHYLDAAIRIAQYAVDTDLHEISALNTLSIHLKRRYQVTSSHGDLTEAIRLVRMAANLATEPGEDRAASFSNLAIYLRLEHDYGRTEQLLQDAIDAANESVKAAGNSPSSVHCLVALSSALEKRYEENGNIDDLKEAVRLSREAEERASNTQDGYPSLLNNLGGQLEVMYLQSGDVGLLDNSIEVTQRACDMAPEGHIDRAMILDNLATRIGRQFQHTGDSELLEESIKSSRLAVQGTEAKHIDLPERLNNLGNKLLLRHIRLPNIKDLDEAINVTKKAIELVIGKRSSYATLRNNLANLLQYKFRYSRDLAFLNEGIDILTDLVEEMERLPKNHPGVASKRHNLAVKLSQRYYFSGNSDDIDKAVDILERTVKNMTQEDQHLPVCLKSLGHGYQTQSMIRQDPPSKIDQALDCFVRASELPQAIPWMRINAVRQAIAILHQKKDWARADKLAGKAMALLPLVCSRHLSREDQVYAISQASGLAADQGSLALRLGEVNRALEHLEFGRGIILGYILDSRSEFNDLKLDHPDLANLYEELRSKANREFEPKASANEGWLLKERRDAVRELEGVVKRIQEHTKYGRFLKGPTIDELKGFATESPVVLVNVTDISSDAIILTKNHTKAISLPELQSRNAPTSLQQCFTQYSLSRAGNERDMSGEDDDDLEGNNLPNTLSWLWSKCVRHILEEMRQIGISLSSADPPRVWWVGSGIASSFPFHAARDISLDPEKDALRLVVSSYSPTIRTLQHSQSRVSSSVLSKGENPSILVVTMPKTPGQKPLDGAEAERRAIEKVCKGIYSIDDSLKSPTADDVSKAIPKSDILHFACHGKSDHVNPLNSHLLLQKRLGDKTVVDRLSASKLSRIAATGKARMVYLSACSTAQVPNSKLRDEGLHIASVFQVLGFLHAIGTLWSAGDDICVEIADGFYSHITQNSKTGFPNDQVARALRSAILSIQSRYPNNPEIWAQFVHFGV
ncbi:hypothetical protein CC78DRAFT_478747 [Lojkania enalia]|uniref:CHAT domain-containing protein n=1 Tax=Lojkania enalia TaxID=147567 RepID=A0A9P4JWY1_9PLEO|nr:hypothetical protein CC78DRAFT_478747 [Didymosphaeria enalia]